MFIRKKAQSTAEYAIAVGLVIAIAAGILQIALKGGIRKKSTEATNFLANAGRSVSAYSGSPAFTATYSVTEDRTTTVNATDYVDEAVMRKGGAELKRAVQTTETGSSSTEVMTFGT